MAFLPLDDSDDAFLPREGRAAGAEPSSGGQDVHPETGATSHGSPVDPSSAAEPGPPDHHGLRQVTWGG